MKKRNWFEILLVTAILAGAGYAAFSDAHNFPNRWFTRDDAYYYFKVAQHISEGLGSTFDGINLANGYHPLWMLINIPIFSLARFDLILPLRVLLMVMGILQAVTAVLLYRLISRLLSETAGMLIAAFWGFSLYIHATVYQFGLETGLTAFAIVLFLTYFEKLERKWRSEPLQTKEIALFALLGVMVLFSRLDTVFLVVFFGLYLIFRKIPLRHLLLTDILGLSVIIFGGFILRVGMKSYYAYGETALRMVLLALLFSLPVYFITGLYRHPRGERWLALLKRTLFAVSLSTGLLAAVILLLSSLGLVGSFPRSVLFLVWGASLLWVGGTRLVFRQLSAGDAADDLSPQALFALRWRTWLKEGAVYFGIVGGALAAYMLFNQQVFGTPTPVSGQVKRWWGSLGGNVYGGAAKRKYTFFGFDLRAESDLNAWSLLTKAVLWLRDHLADWFGYPDSDSAYWLLLFLVVMLLFGILLASGKRTRRASVHFGLIPLVVSSVIQVLSYNATGYSAAKEWYWVTQIIVTLLVWAMLLDIFLRRLTRRFPLARDFALAGTAIVAFFWLQGFFAHLAHLMPYDRPHEGHPYMEILAVVEENTEPGSLIGMTGGGNLGYFIADRQIVNMDGLINSYEYFQAHKAGHGDEYLAAIGLDYVFVNPALLQDLPYRGEFDDRLGEPIAYYRKKAVLKFYANP